MTRIIPVTMAKRSIAILPFLAVFVLTLVGCGGGGGNTSGGGATSGETTSAKTGGGETAPRETTSAGTASRVVNLTPSRDSGVSGTATFTDTGGGVEVQVNVQNLPQIEQPGTAHITHIHEGGTCDDDRAGNGAPVKYPLTPVITQQDATGSSTSTVQGVTVDELFSGSPKYINVHAVAEADETPPGISCGDLVVPTGGDTTGGSTTGASY